MAKSNYRQLKKQREQSKKARKDEKLQKRAVRPLTADSPQQGEPQGSVDIATPEGQNPPPSAE